MIHLSKMPLALAIVMAVLPYYVPAADVICPVATFTVEKVGPTKYAYRAHYSTGPGNYPARYAWRVSSGKIVGNPKSDRIFVDTSRVTADIVTVTLTMRWKNVNRYCNPRVVTDTIRLRE